jgi:DNA-binding MarR family transcriptional regulator
MVMARNGKTTDETSVISSTPDPMDVWRALLLMGKKMPQFFDKVLGPVDLRFTEYKLLQKLAEAGATPMAKLSDEMYVTKAGVTAITDEMEQKGLVKRVRDGDDRRIVNVEMTTAGKKLYGQARQKHLAFVKKFVSDLEPEEIRTLLRIYNKLNQFLEKESPTSF